MTKSAASDRTDETSGEHCRDIPWSLGSTPEGIVGTGNWKYFPIELLPRVYEAAEHWRKQLSGAEMPWLCWCVDEDWCFLQQRLVASCGWTPVVGTDGSVTKPVLIKNAIFVDFNQELRLPTMWMHFPLEFVHRFAPRLAYWHSDVLPPVDVMLQIAHEFSKVNDGELIGVKLAKARPLQILQRLIKRKPLFFKRWWEVIGCTTAGASRSQFENGCGWWRNPQFHPNKSEKVDRANPFREHGVGVYLWEKLFSGRALPLRIDIDPYHYSTNQQQYKRQWKNGKLGQSKHWELRESFNLKQIVAGLGLPAAPDISPG